MRAETLSAWGGFRRARRVGPTWVLLGLTVTWWGAQGGVAAAEPQPPQPSPSPQAPPSPPDPNPTPPPQPEPSPAPSPSPQSGNEPAPWDIGGRVSQAITDWFLGLVEAAVDPVFGLIGRSVMSTPAVWSQEQVHELWVASMAITNTCYVVLIIVGGITVMTHESLQSRYALRDIAPRLVVGMIASNVSLVLIEYAVRLANAVSQAFLARGVDPADVATTMMRICLSAITGTANMLMILMTLVAVVLGLVVVATWIVRIALVMLLTITAPLALACHALPQTQGIASLWWRSLLGCLLTQLGQSLVLIFTVRVGLGSSGLGLFGLPSGSGLAQLLLLVCLLWVMVRIPAWVGRVVAQRPPQAGGRVMKYLVTQQVVRAVRAALS